MVMTSAVDMMAPIFLVGAERSGTTLLRLMLNHHPELAFNLESEFLVTQISDEGEFPVISDYVDFLEHDRVFRHSGFKIRDWLTYKEMVSDFLLQKSESDGKKYVGATVHYSFSKLLLIWPKAKFIYLYRDGRDVANSVVQMGWAGNPYVASEWWLDAENEWRQLRCKLERDQWLEVRYEDLACNAKGELKHLCKFLNVDFSERMFDYVKSSSYGLPDARLTYQWKRKMKSRDLRLVETRIGKQLLDRGYELSDSKPCVVSPLSNRLLQLTSRISCLRNRMFKFGFLLVVQEMFSRRLKFSGWHRAVQAQIDAMVDAKIR